MAVELILEVLALVAVSAFEWRAHGKIVTLTYRIERLEELAAKHEDEDDEPEDP